VLLRAASAGRLKGTWGSTVHTSSSRAIQLQEHACHGLLDEHDQAFIASRVLPDGSACDSYRSAASRCVCATNTDRYTHLMAY
jgi:hypothetical protein